MSYHIHVSTSPNGDGDEFQLFDDNECPYVFRAWAKTHLGCDLYEDGSWNFGGPEDGFKPLPIDDIQSLLECVDRYVQIFISNHIYNPQAYDVFPDIRQIWEKECKHLPNTYLPTLKLGREISRSPLFATLDLFQWLGDQGIIKMDLETSTWRYAPGKQLWIAGW